MVEHGRPSGRHGGELWWAASNPVLGDGETVLNTRDSYRVKLGDGVTPWADLPYVTERTVLPNAANERHMPAADWTDEHKWNDRYLEAGEVGWETDTGLVKFGDGLTPWSLLEVDELLYVEV